MVGEKLFWQNRHASGYGIQIDGSNVYLDYDNVIIKTLVKFSIDKFTNPQISKCYEYIVYKIFSICEKYPDYRKFLEDENGIQINIDGFLDYILKKENRSHITNKLMQVINYIQHYDSLWAKYQDMDSISILELSGELNELIDEQHPLIEMLPPPIFSIKIELIDTASNSDNKITIGNLSSGEQQLIHTTSTIIYHLNNLHSVKQTQLVFSYKSINLIFDEIELYFHPEYQRTLLYNIINRINDAQLHSLKINILFITHSPFILSDIPQQNILKLKNGHSIYIEEENKTFGSNIHDLLANDFFLKSGFMGEFAKCEINKVIESLNYKILFHLKKETALQLENSNNDRQKFKITELEKLDGKLRQLNIPDDKYDAKYCEQIIKLIGEPMLAMSVTELFIKAYKESSNEFIQSQIEWLQKLKNS